MASRPPPVPPANRSRKGPGETSREKKVPADVTPDENETAETQAGQGRHANAEINTTHQGYQQDR